MALATASPFSGFPSHKFLFSNPRNLLPSIRMASEAGGLGEFSSRSALSSPSPPKILDSHLHVWASPQEEVTLIFQGRSRQSLETPISCSRSPPPQPLHALLESASTVLTALGPIKTLHQLIQCMSEAGVDGALIVQPINHMFDHSLSFHKMYLSTLDLRTCFFNWEKDDNDFAFPYDSVLKKHPSKFIGCCLANPAEDGTGIRQLEDLVLKDGYRAVRFNPYLWPSGQKMTNEIGKAMFYRAGELGVPVGIMCMKGLSLHISEIEELCEIYPSTIVLLDHMGFCKPPMTDEKHNTFSSLLKLARFPQAFLLFSVLPVMLIVKHNWDEQVYVKFSALFRISRKQYPYEDAGDLLSQVISNYGANRVMWGSDFPFVVKECGYKEAREAVSLLANQIPLSSSDLEWIMGRTLGQLFQ
ncbi:Amidohydrolase [Musa troglodytarum]|uniref:Amidohydrolase n=1 Tax=Musa troglodytarum TaxID=320322 RepID=A0A9E7K9N1_9LILI|nr:Amidohydrolase [Musa troglodytarum]